MLAGFSKLDHPLQLKEEHVFRTGYLMIVWNRIEFEIDAIVALSIRGISTRTTETLLSARNISDRADGMADVVRDFIADSGIRDAVEKCSKKIKSQSNFRNAIAHGRWSGLESQTKFVTGKKINTNDIDKNLEELILIHNEMLNLRRRIMIYRLISRSDASGRRHDFSR